MSDIKGMPGDAGSISRQMRYMLQAIRDVKGGNPINETEQTKLTYKLDIDERGVLRSSTPQRSHAAVTNQEQTNIRRLSAEARKRGEDVVDVRVKYKTKIVDGQIAIVAGKTEVTSRDSGHPDPTSQHLVPGTGDESLDEYKRIGAANRAAAESMKLFDLEDDASVRGLSGGLIPNVDTSGAGGPQSEVRPDSISGYRWK